MKQRVKALKKLQYESIKHVKVNFYVELHALETKYQELFAPLDQRVSMFYCLSHLLYTMAHKLSAYIRRASIK